MKLHIKTIIAATSCALLLSCSSDISDNAHNVAPSDKTTTISISLDDTRTFIGENSDDSYPLYWSEGDKISVNGIESAEAVINPNDPSFASFVVKGEVGNKYNIAYPSAPLGKVLFAENQAHHNSTTFGRGALTMYGVGSNASVQLKPLAGILKIGIIGSSTLSCVEISTADNAPISGLFDIDFTTGKLTPTADSKSTINYSFGEGVELDKSTPTYVHIAVPAGEYAALNLRFCDSRGSRIAATVKASEAKPIAAGTIFEFRTPVCFTPSDVEVGKTLPLWDEGYLDIHFINSARGECCFYILPDGTTLIVDAGEIPVTYGESPITQRPNITTRPYITYATYIKHFMPAGRTSLDYCHLSHFHFDHLGSRDVATETAPAGYRKAGLLALYDQVPFNHVLDRCYPDYIEKGEEGEDDKTPPIIEGELAQDWKTFVKWGEEEGKLTAERFAAGKEQITMLYNKQRYSNFKLFNICVNGYAYYLVDGTPKVKGAKSDGGNPASCGFHIRYGEFDYIACGDLASAPQNRMAYYFRDFIGSGHLDAFKGNHHLSSNSWGSQMKANNFDPQVVLNQNFYKKQPDAGILEHIYTLTHDVFTTNVHPDLLEESNAALYTSLAGYNGHIVLRVMPGGESFYVYMLDDGDFEYRVKSIHGPYTSK